MSNIDPTIQTTSGVESRQTSSARDSTKTSESRRVATNEANASRQTENRPDTASEVLQRVAERALERPPRDIQKLTASAAKFLLINLEPAMQLAEDLREISISRSAKAMTDMLVDGRQDRAVALLSELHR